jgi:hypothetical protein
MAKKKQAVGTVGAGSLQNKGAIKESGKERSLRNLGSRKG